MKATGIVRRIDDLGRVVIPKEIRRTMRIREGDPLEIYTDAGGEVIFKKYSPVGELSSYASQYAEALRQETDLAILICDRDRCVAAAGVSKKETVEHRISPELENVIESRKTFIGTKQSEAFALEGAQRRICVAVPIVSAGDISGAVVLSDTAERQEASESDVKLAAVAAGFLGRLME